MLVRILCAVVALLPLVASATPSQPPVDTLGLPLVTKANLTYAGAFRFPNLPYTGNVCDGWTFGGRGLTWNPAGNSGNGSLFSTGHNYCSNVGEFSIPALKIATDPSTLNYATLLQVQPSSIVDPLEGKMATSGLTGGTHNTVNGLLVKGGRLIVSVGNDYSTVEPPVSHYSRSLNLSTTGVNGPVKVSGNKTYTNPRLLSGYMCHLPTSLQSTFGFSAFTGWVPQSIVSNSSNGPSAFGFNPSSLEGVTTLSAETTLVYPVGKPLQDSVTGQSQSTWNWTSMTRGCAVPNGTGSLLFVGRHGVGTFNYCVGSSDPTSTCYDPTDSSSGEHAYPYVYKIWAYRLSDLLAVKAGTITPEAVQPYNVWTFTLPNENKNGAHELGGVAYDPATKRLFVVENSALPAGEPIIHVFTVDNAVSQTVTY